MSSIQSAETLATAGFYYQNTTDDQVRCFQCNGGLRSWQNEDDAWFEHARWFPKCEFVQLVKGHQYIAQVQKQTRPTLVEAMSGEPVLKALQMGLNEGRVRAVTKYHLDRFGGPFKSAEALIDAVLDYQREEDQRHEDQQIYDDDDDHNIVRAVNRILDTIFKHNRDSATEASEASTSHSESHSNFSLMRSQPESSSLSQTQQLSDDFVVVQIPRQSSMDTFAVDDEGGMRNIQRFSRNQINEPTQMRQISSSGPTHTQITESTESTESTSVQTATPTISPLPSSSLVPECSRLSHFEVLSTASDTMTQITKSSLLSESEKSLSLEEENRQLKDARLCKVCMDGDVAVVFLPCGHLGTLRFKYQFLFNSIQILMSF